MVWEKIYNLLKRIFTIDDDLTRLQAELKRQGDQIREIAINQTRFQYELQLQRERDAHEQEQAVHKLELVLRDRAEGVLRLELQQLRERLERAERLSLPPSPPKPPDEPSKD